MNRYKLILTNERIYREIPLANEAAELTVGTRLSDQVRLRQEEYARAFGMRIRCEGGLFRAHAAEGTLFRNESGTGMREKELHHGDVFFIADEESAEQIVRVQFVPDYDYEPKEYDGFISLNAAQPFTIGAAQDCNIVLREGVEADDLIRVAPAGDALRLHIAPGTRNAFVNGRQAEGECVAGNMDFFSLGGTGFYVRSGRLFVSNCEKVRTQGLSVQRFAESSSALRYPKFNRSTQTEIKLSADPIEILDPPAKPSQDTKNIIVSLLPSLVMLAMVIVVRGVMSTGSNMSMILFSAVSMTIGIITSVCTWISSRNKYKKDVQEREDTYRTYIRNKTEEITEARREEVRLLNERFPDEARSESLIEYFSGELFDRAPESENYLKVRLGSGETNAMRPVQYNERQKLTAGDELEEMPKMLAETYGTVSPVPVICDIRAAGNIGVIGNDASRHAFLKNFVLDLATHHYFGDVKLFFIMDESRKKQMRWIRFLPHVKNEETNMRNIVCDEADKMTVFEYLYKELSYREGLKKDSVMQDIIVFLLDDKGLKQHPISRFFKQAAACHVHFISFEEHAEHLPMYCGVLIRLRDEANGTMVMQQNREERTPFAFRALPDMRMRQLVRKLAPVYCEEISLESQLTKSVTLFDLYGIFSAKDLDLSARWAKRDIADTMAAPVGLRIKNEEVLLDLHEKADGPHGLVAGTTGSGKSEMLQTYILSMAMNYSPYEVGFVLIDFKGGGMANQFRALPHLLGAITDIDGKEINRSLLSIRAELDRRKELFAQANVNSIRDYILKFRSGGVRVPLPHLIIIVDEFAELKAEQPEFMKELISASRIGRSLGVHLILATQKPSGQVSEQIWSNSRFRICLKVQTPEDSNEMLKSPLAAEITEPGRAYLQVGNNEIFELFQSAYSGAPETPEHTDMLERAYRVSEVDFSGRRTVIFEQRPSHTERSERTQLEAVVQYVHDYCDAQQIAKLPDICLPPLPDMLPFVQGERSGGSIVDAVIGTYDAPARQYQGDVRMRITGVNTVVIGSSQYGKTNLLQVLIRSLASQYTPDEVHIYVMDFASLFLKNYAELPHVGGVVTADDEERVKNLFKLLRREIVLRKDKLAKAGVTSFEAYREGGYRDLAQIVLMVDNFTALKETYLGDDDPLLQICREGAALGISTIICNTITSGFGYRYFSTVSGQIAFTCNEADEYNSVFGYTRERPASVPGRCLISIDKEICEAQTCLAFAGEKEIDRAVAVREFVQTMREHYPDSRARQIPSVPQTLTAKGLYAMFPGLNVRQEIPFGVDYESIEAQTLRLREQFMLALLGKNTEGKKRFVDLLLSDIRQHVFERKVQISMVDAAARPYVRYENMPFMEKYTSHAEGVLDIIEHLHAALAERQAQTDDGEAGDAAWPLKLLLINHKKAVEMLSASKEHMNLFREISSEYRDYGVLIVFADMDDVSAGFGAPEIYKLIKEEKRALIFENLKNVKLFDIPVPQQRRNSAELGVSDAFLLSGEEVLRVKIAQEEAHEQ